MDISNEKLAQFAVGFASTLDCSELQRKILLEIATRLRSKDSERLDWLEKNVVSGATEHGYVQVRVDLFLNNKDSLRASIDSAMSKGGDA